MSVLSKISLSLYGAAFAALAVTAVFGLIDAVLLHHPGPITRDYVPLVVGAGFVFLGMGVFIIEVMLDVWKGNLG
jgi:hypothetical protein